jgi:hypothetical protein
MVPVAPAVPKVPEAYARQQPQPRGDRYGRGTCGQGYSQRIGTTLAGSGFNGVAGLSRES